MTPERARQIAEDRGCIVTSAVNDDGDACLCISKGDASVLLREDCIDAVTEAAMDNVILATLEATP